MTTMRERALILRLAALVAFSLLAVQLVRIQVFESPRYRELAAQQQTRTLAVDAPRGLITDRNGVILARNVPTYAVEVVPADVPTAPTARAAVLMALERQTGNHHASIDAVVDQGMHSTDPFAPIRLQSGLDTESAIAARAALADLPGVHVTVSPMRVYEGGDLLPHILGSVGPIQPDQVAALQAKGYPLNAVVGQGGVEATFEQALRGTANAQLISADPTGRPLSRLGSTPARPGEDVELAIDVNLQRVAAEALRDGIVQGTPTGGHDADGKSALAAGAAVVMDVRTGEVRAMVSLPTYDANAFTGAAEGVTRLLTDPTKPLLDRAYMEVHPPGSIFKPIVGLAALQEGVATPSTRITSTGSISVPNEYDPSIQYVFRDWAVHGTLDFNGGIARSSDVYFYYLAGGYRDFQGLGPQRIATYARAFGLGSPTGIDLPGEAPGLVPDPEWKQATVHDGWLLGDTYTFGIGQGYLTTTPLQMAVAVSAIANGGDVLKPRIVSALRGSDGTHVTPRVVRGRVPASAQHFEEVRAAMLAAAAPGGTAEAGRPVDLDIGAKTGTAEFGTQLPDGQYDSHGWYTAFAPYDHPEIAVVVYLEHGVGATHAGPVARKVMEAYFAGRDGSPPPDAAP
jgi:penicillin-binding protein 2